MNKSFYGQYIVVIDAGGTKTVGTLVEMQSKKILFQIQTGPGNIVSNNDYAEQNIEDALIQCAEQIQIKPLRAIIGIAGFNTYKHRWHTPLHWYNYINENIAVTSDIELAYRAEFPEGEGMLVISGTGAIICLEHQNKLKTLGGWGHLLGDEESAYGIGKKAIQQVLESMEYCYRSILKDQWIKDDYPASSNKLKEWFYSQDKEAIAQLSLWVESTAKNGNSEAQSIISDASRKMAGSVYKAITSLGLSSSIPLIVKGGMFENNDRYFSEFQKHISNFQLTNTVSKSNKNIFVEAACFNYYKGVRK
ncbi:BadF/BadG/BcrA/BcrD ATPase family protein [Marinococcus sp. PL1-022]|uniref:BadF/BadG/BcrA/BcrD ATPase family protein n=1 Tax=Marinococcus sp. PL1-022 TaxID=3095363 RepID=UPI0029C1EBE6|nr:BadF/BadG/BcrA/BcrD ATPase family protein [Marinococcus sp. PL1-022]MDX6153170.1 BadF/BadG/BcrA/BcrD ATPase family protein [Marinococcus sp. PL1-022]